MSVWGDWRGYGRYGRSWDWKAFRWWGVDFSRFSAAISEMSTWSGTKSPSCKPVALGNVFIAK